MMTLKIKHNDAPIYAETSSQDLRMHKHNAFAFSNTQLITSNNKFQSYSYLRMCITYIHTYTQIDYIEKKN